MIFEVLIDMFDSLIFYTDAFLHKRSAYIIYGDRYPNAFCGIAHVEPSVK